MWDWRMQRALRAARGDHGRVPRGTGIENVFDVKYSFVSGCKFELCKSAHHQNKNMFGLIFMLFMESPFENQYKMYIF